MQFFELVLGAGTQLSLQETLSLPSFVCDALSVLRSEAARIRTRKASDDG